MTIPLAKLLSINDIWIKVYGGTPPIEGYDKIKPVADRMERGEFEKITPQVVERMRNLCWSGITRLYLETTLAEISDVESGRRHVEDKPRALLMIHHLAAEGILKKLGVEPTKENILEFLDEIDKRSNDPGLDWLRKKYS